MFMLHLIYTMVGFAVLLYLSDWIEKLWSEIKDDSP